MPNSIINKLILNGTTYDMHDVRLESLNSSGIVAYDATHDTFSITNLPSGAMTFVGTSSTDPKGESGATVSGHTTWKVGDVVLYHNLEYVNTTGTNPSATTPNPNWEELGDGASYALKTTTITAGNGLTGGGDLSDNRTINVGAGNGISVASDSVSIKLKHSGQSNISGLTVDSDGLSVNSGAGIEIDSNGAVAVKLDDNDPTNGQGLEFDGHDNLVVKLKASGSGLKFDNGTGGNNGLEVKLTASYNSSDKSLTLNNY